MRIAGILRDRNNWRRYLAWQGKLGNAVRPAVRYHVRRVLACCTAAMGASVYRCAGCGTLRVVPHSCKSRFCSSCGTARTRDWCERLLSDLLAVPYRHLIFTIPWQLRLLIRDNRGRLERVMFRAAADAVLALTRGDPVPLGRKGRARMKRRRKRYLPGMLIALHTFGSDLKRTPHWHMMVTAGGLALDGTRWFPAPSRSLVSAVELATEWRLRVVAGILQEHRRKKLYCRRLRSDRRRRLNVERLLGFIGKSKWRVRIGPALEDASGAVKYCARYSRRPALGETRIAKYDGCHVTFRYKDYYRGGKPAWMKLPVLQFIDRLVQHIPEKNARHLRYYGLFASRVKTRLLAAARKALGQRKRRRPAPASWMRRRQAAGEKHPLRCPNCGGNMQLHCQLFGSPAAIAEIIGIEPHEKMPYRTCLPAGALRNAAG